MESTNSFSDAQGAKSKDEAMKGQATSPIVVDEDAAEEEDMDGDEAGESQEDDMVEEEEEADDNDDDEITNFTQSEIVTVYVGPKRKRFYLHRELVCQRSPFMEKCLKNDHFEEGQKNEVYLPEDDPKAFSIVVNWIYRSALPSSADPLMEVSDMSAAYCLADKFGMEELQNSIMDNIRASFARRENESCKTPNFAALTLSHITGPHKSPIKRFLVEHLVYHMMKHPRWYHDLKRDSPPRLELEEVYKHPDLVAYLMKKVQQWQMDQWKDPASLAKCCYHIHVSTTCEARQAAQVAKQARQVRLELPPALSTRSSFAGAWGPVTGGYPLNPGPSW